MSIDAAFTHFPSLFTERLHLRQFQPTDAEALFAIRSDPDVMEFLGLKPHQSLDDAYAAIERFQTLYEHREAIIWGMALKDEEMLIGSCLFFHFGPEFRYAETGYELNRAYWRQGLASEAMSAILTYGFDELDFHRIEANIDLRNTRSRNLLLKLGFTYEGNLRQRYYFRGQFKDEHYFGLLKDEWSR